MRSVGAGTRLLGAMVAFAVVAACRRGQDAPPPPPASARPSPAADASALPPGHPPVDAGLPSGHPSVGGVATGGHGGAPVGVGGLAWKHPASWKEETPSSGMRRAQYRVSGPGGPAECVVFYFGAGEGGDPRANAERWAGQFTRADGTPAALKTWALDGAPVDVTMVEVRGTYHGGPTMGGGAPPGPQPGSMLLGAIAEGPDANWFFKFTGPEKTVAASRADFEGMLRSLKSTGKSTS